MHHSRSASNCLRVVTALLLAGMATAAMAGQVYQWKDDKGVTHYSDKPPTGQQYKDRRIDTRGEPMVEANSASKAVDSPQCTTAKLNASLLKSSNPVRQADAEGNPGKQLDDSERANQLNLAEAAIKAYCTPAASTGTAGT